MTVEAAVASKIPSIFSGIDVMDADSHVSEWPDLWTSRASSKWRDRVPQIRGAGKGRRWMIDGDKPLGMIDTAGVVLKDGRKDNGLEFMSRPLADTHAASYDVRARVAYLDSVGIRAQILYPNVLGFGGQKALLVDPDLRLVSTKIFNDAMGEMQADSGGRVLPMALLPWWDLKEAIAEAHRCHAMGMRGINMNPDPHDHGLPDMSDPYWYPLWEALCDLDMPVNFHIGASDESMTWMGQGFWPSHSDNKKFAFGSLMLFVGNLRVMGNILLSGMLDRFPKLKIVSVESGMGWVPFMLEGLQYEFNEVGINQTPVREVFNRQIYVCSWFEKEDLAHTIRRIGIDNVMFETDFPHPTCLYPDPLNGVAEAAATLTLDERRKFFGGNCARVYNIAV